MTAEFISTADALVAIAVEKVSSRFPPPVPLFAPMPIKPYGHISPLRSKHVANVGQGGENEQNVEYSFFIF